MLLIASVVGKRSSCFAILAIEIEAEKREMAKLPSTLAGETGKRRRRERGSAPPHALVRTSVAAFPSPILALRFVISCSASALPSIILLGFPIALLSDAVWCRTALVLVGRRFVKEGQAGRQAEEKRALLLVWFCCCCCCFGCAPAICLLLSVLPSSASLFFCGFVSRLRFRCRIVNLLPANFVCEERQAEVPHGLRESSENGSSAQDEIGTSAAEISA